MKKIMTMHNFVDETTEKIILLTPKRNKYFIFENNKFFKIFINNNQIVENKKEIIFRFIKLNFNEDFAKSIINSILEIHNNVVPNIKTSNELEIQEYGIMHKGNIEKLVYALIYKYMYYQDQEKNKDLFDFCSELLFKLTNEHIFYNGNKRTALITLSYVLSSFGFYLYWSSERLKYVKEWESFMLYIASSKEKNISGEEVLKYIKSEIINKTCLSFSFEFPDKY